jgi:hypothetical protein
MGGALNYQRLIVLNPVRSSHLFKRAVTAAPFFIEVNKSRIFSAVEIELERAFQNQAACEGLNVFQRQSVMSSSAQLIDRVHYTHHSPKIPHVHWGDQLVGHPIIAVDHCRNDLVQLAARRRNDVLDQGEVFEFVGYCKRNFWKPELSIASDNGNRHSP